VYLGLEKLKRGTNPRKALLLITDGEDNHSRYTASSIKEVLKEMNVEVYAIGITDYVPAPPRQPGRAALKELGAMSGGRTFFIDSVHELEDICLKVALLLKRQYVIGYRSSNAAKDGRWRKIRIKVNPPKGVSRLTVRCKSGYYGAIEATSKSN